MSDYARPEGIAGYSYSPSKFSLPTPAILLRPNFSLAF